MNKLQNRIGMIIMLVMFGLILGVVLAPSITGYANQDRVYEIGMVDSELLTEMDRMFAEVYNRVGPSVVAITALARGGDALGTATGSGFVIDLQGHIVTNYHVVADAARIEISMFDGTITRAEVVGLDPNADIAVIRVDLPQDRLYPVPLGDSEALEIGQTVLAIGNPFSNNWTLTSGIVSALNRRIAGLNNNSIGGVIQTDAAINPGNSGGPLLNLRGEVIGVNSQIDSQFRQNSGIGFAVPSNLVKRVVDELIATGRVNYSYIGILSRPIDLDLIEEFDLPNNIRGVAVGQAVQQEPAALAGLRSISNTSVDVITAINGRAIRDFDELVGYLAIHTNPGETVTLTVYRSQTREVLQLQVTLIQRPQR